MEAKELRIGNWCYDKRYRKCTFSRIEAEGNFIIQDSLGDISTPKHYIKPIPLSGIWSYIFMDFCLRIMSQFSSS